MEPENWPAFQAELDAMPTVVLLDTSQAVLQFQQPLRTWGQAGVFTEQVCALLVDYAADPALDQHTFSEDITLLCEQFNVLDHTDQPVSAVAQRVRDLGTTVCGQLMQWQLYQPGRRMLYHFDGLLGWDIALRKATTEEVLDALCENG